MHKAMQPQKCVSAGVHSHVEIFSQGSYDLFQAELVFQALSDASSGDPQCHDGAVPESVWTLQDDATPMKMPKHQQVVSPNLGLFS